MAEALTRHALGARGIDVSVASCGMLESGRSAPREVQAVMADRGLDVSAHLSRQMTPAIVKHASLILGMERQHVREIVTTEPSAFAHTFTLPEIVRRLDALSDTERAPIERGDLESVLAVLGKDRTRRDLLGRSDADEVDDPIGRPMRAFVKAADEIESLVAQLVAHLWPMPVDEAPQPHEAPQTHEVATVASPQSPDAAPLTPGDRGVTLRDAARQRRAAALRGPVRRIGRTPRRTENR